VADRDLIPFFRTSEKGTNERIRALRKRLSISGGLLSPRSREKSRSVFGRVLPPEEIVNRIVQDVRKRGDRALFEYIRKIEGVRLGPKTLRVSKEEMDCACRKVSRRFLLALRKAIRNVRQFQRTIKPPLLKRLSRGGATISFRLSPLRRIGVYVPGGSAALASSVYMSAVPAQVAGVGEIALATPCRSDGSVSEAVLATCNELGISEVYRMGGAQAIAAFAFGTQTVPRVDKVVGPGNIFVSLAKKEVFGEVDIDLFAGPSEVVIVADGRADAALIAADMLSQAEHNPACAILITPSFSLARAVRGELARQLKDLKRKEAAGFSLSNYGMILVTRSLKEAFARAEEISPEHLEIQTENPRKYLAKVKNAGAIFLGADSPEAVGDYIAGPSHTLPTGGTARFLSGLSVKDFLKATSIVEFSSRGLRCVARDVIELAMAEEMDGHAASIRRRVGGKK